MIAIVDYGVGNLFSLCCSLEAVGAQPVVTGDAGVLLQADGVDPGGGRTNNLWLIWLISDLCLCTLGYAAEVLMRRKRSRESEKRPS